MPAAIPATTLAPGAGIAATSAQAAYPANTPFPTEIVTSCVVFPLIKPPLKEMPFSRLHPELPVSHGVNCQLEPKPISLVKYALYPYQLPKFVPKPTLEPSLPTLLNE